MGMGLDDIIDRLSDDLAGSYNSREYDIFIYRSMYNHREVINIELYDKEAYVQDHFMAYIDQPYNDLLNDCINFLKGIKPLTEIRIKLIKIQLELYKLCPDHVDLNLYLTPMEDKFEITIHDHLALGYDELEYNVDTSMEHMISQVKDILDHNAEIIRHNQDNL